MNILCCITWNAIEKYIIECPENIECLLDQFYFEAGNIYTNAERYDEALEYYKTEEPRGEYVLVLEGKSLEEKRQEEISSWENMSIEEHMAYYENQGMDEKSAMKQVAKDRGVGIREIYQYLHVD